MPVPQANPLGQGDKNNMAETTNEISQWLEEREDPKFVPESKEGATGRTAKTMTEITQPAQEENPEAEAKESPEPVAKEEPEAEAELDLEPETEPEAELAEPEAKTETEPEAQVSEEPLSVTLAELAQSSKMEQAELLDAIKVDVTVDGVTSTVSLREARDGYSKDAKFRQGTAANAEQRQSLDAETATLAQERQYYQETLFPLIQQMQQQLTEESADMAELAQNDPSAWIEKKQEMEVKQAALSQAQYEAQQMEQSNIAKLQTQMVETVRAEEAKMIQAIPEWKDAEVAKAEVDQIRTYAISRGVPPEDANNMFMESHILIARDAMQWRDHQAKMAKIKNKEVAKVPRVVRPGASEGPAKPQGKAETAKNRLRKTGNVKDLANALSSMGLGDKRR